MTESAGHSEVDRYGNMIRAFAEKRITADDFVDAFLNQWRTDRDTGVVTSAHIDHLMTSCDCYSPVPIDAWTVNADRLRTDAETTLSTLQA